MKQTEETPQVYKTIMDTHNIQSSQKRGGQAQWPTQVSHVFLELYLQHRKSGRGGDNGLRMDQLIAISTALKEHCNVIYNPEQCKNHYRVWKNRLTSLWDLQNKGGFGWNPTTKRFDTPVYVWNDLRKEQKYWRDHPVLPIHQELADLFSQENASGDSAHIESGNASNDVVNVEFTETHVDLNAMEPIPNDLEQSELTQPGSPTLMTTRKRGKPSLGGLSGKEKKTKGTANKLSSSIKMIAHAIDRLVSHDPKKELAENLTAALELIPDLNFENKMKAMTFFMKNKDEANVFLVCKKEEKHEVLAWYIKEGRGG